jgi:hypothetical protein
MANKVFGEARLTLEDDRELTLRYDFNAMIEAEEAANMGTEEIMKALAAGSPRLKVARAMLYGGLRYHHDDISLDEAGDLFMSDSEAVSEAMGRAMDEMAKRRGANPPKGVATAKANPPPGIGTRSTRSGAKRG